MIIQHGDARTRMDDQDFYLNGMKAGREAFKRHPGWSDGDLAVQSADKAIIYLMSAPEGAVKYMNGFEKGYRTSK